MVNLHFVYLWDMNSEHILLDTLLWDMNSEHILRDTLLCVQLCTILAIDKKTSHKYIFYPVPSLFCEKIMNSLLELVFSIFSDELVLRVRVLCTWDKFYIYACVVCVRHDSRMRVLCTWDIFHICVCFVRETSFTYACVVYERHVSRMRVLCTWDMFHVCVWCVGGIRTPDSEPPSGVHETWFTYACVVCVRHVLRVLCAWDMIHVCVCCVRETCFTCACVVCMRHDSCWIFYLYVYHVVWLPRCFVDRI